MLINTLASGHIHPVGTRRNILQNEGDRGDRDVDDDASSQGSAGSFAEPKGQVRVYLECKSCDCRVSWHSHHS